MADNLDQIRTLSTAARARVDWQRITDAFGLQSGTMRQSGGSADDNTLITPEERSRLQKAVDLAGQEFDTALGSLRRLSRLVIGGIVVALAIAIVGGALLQLTPYASIISVAGIGSLFALLTQAWRISRDQVMLELIPARYSLAVEFCRTRKDVQRLVAAFLDETSSLRSANGQNT